MNKIVAVTSGKGGTGKSTFSVSLGISASKRNEKVLIIDMDAGMRCLDMLLGISSSVLMDVSDVVGGADLESSLLEVPSYKGLYLLPAPAEENSVNPEAFGKFIEDVSDKYSLIIIDFPAGSNLDFYKFLPRETDFICICNPDPVSIRDAALIGQQLRSVKKNGFLVINKYTYFVFENKGFKTLDDIIDAVGLQLIGIIPQSLNFSYAFITGDFRKLKREFKCVNRIYSRLEGKNIPLVKLKKLSKFN